MKRPQINITPLERIGRVVIGGGAAVAGSVLLIHPGGALVAVLDVFLILAGLDLLVTGAIGFCPLYKRLGYVPKSLRRPA